jgi:hypothetical protein
MPEKIDPPQDARVAAEELDRSLERARQLQSEGQPWSIAFGIAHMEERLRHWPPGWGDKMHILVYGDFEPPSTALTFASLGIVVHPEKLTNTIIRSALTVLLAEVDIADKTVASLQAAIARINLLLGAITLESWGNSPVRWWSYVVHPAGGGVTAAFDVKAVDGIVSARGALPRSVQKKLDAALYWVREPRSLVLDAFRSDALRMFAAYWNAFECLVHAVSLLRPAPAQDAQAVQATVDDFLQTRGGRLTPDAVRQLSKLVDPGFRAQARHALEVCFGEHANHYFNECFSASPKERSLYRIRNSVNHGFVDAENPEHLVVVEARLHVLWRMVWAMFGRIVPFSTPAISPY